MRISTSEFTYKMLSNTERAMRALKAFEFFVECAAFLSGDVRLTALQTYVNQGRTLFTIVRIPEAYKKFFHPELQVGKDIFPKESWRDFGSHLLNTISPLNNIFMGSLVPLAVQAGWMDRRLGLGCVSNLIASVDCFISSNRAAGRPEGEFEAKTDTIGGIKSLMESAVNVAQYLGCDSGLLLILKSGRSLGLWQSIRQTQQEINDA